MAGRTDEGQNIKKYSALAGRIAIVLISLSLVGVLILWDMGYLEIPFLVRRKRQEEPKTEPQKETETIEIVQTDWGAIAKAALSEIYKAEFVENFAGRITTAKYEKGINSLVKTPLLENFTDYALGFLAEESGCILRASDLTRIPDSEGYSLTGKKDLQGRAVFQKKDSGAYFILNGDTLSFEEIAFDPQIIPLKEGQENTEIIEENSLFGYKGKHKVGRQYKPFTVDPQYTTAFPFRENFAIAADANGKITILNLLGQPVFTNFSLVLPDPSHEDAESFYYFDYDVLRVIIATYDENGSLVSTRESAINSQGEEVVFPAGYSAVSYKEGFFVLTKDGNYGYYSYNGQWITSPIYDECSPFSEGIAVVKNKNGKYGLIDTQGNELLPCCLDQIESFSNGHTLAYSEGTGWFLLSKVEGVFPPSEEDVPPQELPPQTKVTITRGPQNTFEHEEEIIIETPIIPPNTTRKPHPEYWE